MHIQVKFLKRVQCADHAHEAGTVTTVGTETGRQWIEAGEAAEIGSVETATAPRGEAAVSRRGRKPNK